MKRLISFTTIIFGISLISSLLLFYIFAYFFGNVQYISLNTIKLIYFIDRLLAAYILSLSLVSFLLCFISLFINTKDIKILCFLISVGFSFTAFIMARVISDIQIMVVYIVGASIFMFIFFLINGLKFYIDKSCLLPFFFSFFIAYLFGLPIDGNYKNIYYLSFVPVHMLSLGLLVGYTANSLSNKINNRHLVTLLTLIIFFIGGFSMSAISPTGFLSNINKILTISIGFIIMAIFSFTAFLESNTFNLNRVILYLSFWFLSSSSYVISIFYWHMKFTLYPSLSPILK